MEDKIYTLSDIEGAEFAEFPLAVLGKPIAHSLSPLMQNKALEFLAKKDKKFSAWRYYKFEIDPSELELALKKLHAKGFVGLNLTIPHKEIIFKFLESADEFSCLAKAANTLSRTSMGWTGTNTDGFGLEKAIQKFTGKSFKDADVVLLGAGGAARAAAFYILRSNAKSLQIFNRTESRADALISEIELAGYKAQKFSEISENSIIINATSVGLKTDDLPVLDFAKLSKTCTFFDMPYAKGRETSSVLAARKAGLSAASGRDMLAWQGAKALSVWTKQEILGELMSETLADL